MAINKKVKEKRAAINYTDAKKVSEKQAVQGNSAIKLPEGFYNFIINKAGTYRFDILPFVVGKGNPYAEKGSVHYERTYWVNRNLGVNPKIPYCSLLRNWNEKDPVQELVAKLSRDPNTDEEVLKSLNTSQRQLFIVKDHKNPDKGFGILDVSNHCFGKKLAAKLRADEDGDYSSFFHLQGGMTLKATFEEKKAGQFSFVDCVDIEFKARTEDYEDEVLDQMPCLDDLLVKVPYDELKAIIEGAEPEEDEDAPKAKTKKKVEADDDDEPAPKKKAKPKKEEDDEDEDDGSDDGESDAGEDNDGDDSEGGGEEDDAEADEAETEGDDDADGDDDAPAAVTYKKGMRVKFTNSKGKEFKGTITAVKKDSEVIHVDIGNTTPATLDFDDETIKILKPKEAPVEEDDEPAPKKKVVKVIKKPAAKKEEPEEEDDDEPAPKKKAVKGDKKKTAFEEEEEDEDFAFGDDDE